LIKEFEEFEERSREALRMASVGLEGSRFVM
jgi:hypothetical protein